MKRSDEMTSDPGGAIDRGLMRLLHGEASEEEAARLRGWIDEDPDVAERYRELASIWGRMELPEITAGEDFLPQVRARIAAGRDESVAAMWRLAPAWGRAVAMGALAIGIALGVAVGASDVVSADEIALEDWLLEEWELGDGDLTLVESYWLAIEDDLDSESEAESTLEQGVSP
jgi:ferric-dicitrate binding protein FerR (iron transport regulator)